MGWLTEYGHSAEQKKADFNSDANGAVTLTGMTEDLLLAAIKSQPDGTKIAFEARDVLLATAAYQAGDLDTEEWLAVFSPHPWTHRTALRVMTMAGLNFVECQSKAAPDPLAIRFVGIKGEVYP